MSPRGWLMSITKQKDKKADQIILHVETQTGADLLGHWLEFSAVTIGCNTPYKQKIYIHCCSLVVREDDGEDNFVWADYRDNQAITKHPIICTSLLASSDLPLLSPKSHDFYKYWNLLQYPLRRYIITHLSMDKGTQPTLNHAANLVSCLHTVLCSSR